MYFRLFAFSLLIFIASCSGKNGGRDGDGAAADTSGGNYFSMREFVRDQWEMNKGLPITLLKTVTKDGHTDSAWVSGYKVGIGKIMETFVKTDIGERKFLGQYDVDVIEDDISDSRTLYYEAKSPELYTRKLQIVTDTYSGRIKSIFVEAAEKKGWKRTAVKLYYAPGKMIQVQEHIEARTGSGKDIKTEYYFH